MFRLLWQKKALIAFLIVLIVLLPSAASRPAQMLSKTLLSEITIDKVDNEYTLTGKKVETKPGSQTSEKETKPLETAGPSVGAAINKMSADSGQEVSFAHCTLIVLGEGLRDENLADLLKYFLHRTELNNNCELAWKEKGNNKTTLEKFYKDYMRKTSTSILSQGPSEIAVFKNGKYHLSLDETQTQALDFALGKTVKQRILYENHVLQVINNKADIKTKYINGTPIINLTIKTKLELESNPQATTAELANIKYLLEQKLRQEIEQTAKHCYFNAADPLHLFEKFQPKGISLELSDLYSRIQFNVKVDLHIIT